MNSKYMELSMKVMEWQISLLTGISRMSRWEKAAW